MIISFLITGFFPFQSNNNVSVSNRVLSFINKKTDSQPIICFILLWMDHFVVSMLLQSKSQNTYKIHQSSWQKYSGFESCLIITLIQALSSVQNIGIYFFKKNILMKKGNTFFGRKLKKKVCREKT